MIRSDSQQTVTWASIDLLTSTIFVGYTTHGQEFCMVPHSQRHFLAKTMGMKIVERCIRGTCVLYRLMHLWIDVVSVHSERCIDESRY